MDFKCCIKHPKRPRNVNMRSKKKNPHVKLQAQTATCGQMLGHNGVNAIHKSPALLKDHCTMHANPLLDVLRSHAKHCFSTSTLGHKRLQYL